MIAATLGRMGSRWESVFFVDNALIRRIGEHRKG
jgi:hypothetical protein